jgi:hypothetical protein
LLYASQDGNTLIVAAGDELIEFENFIKSQADVEAASIGASRMAQADFMTMLTDKRLDGMKRPPLMITFDTDVSLSAYVAANALSLIKLYPLQAKSKDMITAFKAETEEQDDRSIAEIHGLEDETRGQDDDPDVAKKMKKAQGSGNISGDSFGPSKKKKKEEVGPDGKITRVTDINVSRNADGSLNIDNVLGVKDDFSDEAWEAHKKLTQQPVEGRSMTAAEALAAQREREAQQMTETEKFRAEAAAKEEIDSEDTVIDIHGIVAIFHKVEVEGQKIADIRPVLTAAGIDIESAVRKQNNALGCWLAYMRQLQAEEVAKALTDAGMTVDCFGVNDAGERLAPKGVQVVDELAVGETHPRPWNFRAKEISKMSKAEKEANWKTLSGKEFLITGRYRGADKGTIVYIVPLTHFKATGTMWKKPLNIGRILPQDVEEIEPGVYRTMSRDWNKLSYDLASRGFKESLKLQLYLNNL